jgi:hypothetical protein
MSTSMTPARAAAQAAALRLSEDLRRMVADTIDQPDPTAPRRTFRFLLLSRRANGNLSKLVNATNALEAEAVTRQDPASAAAIHAIFDRARKERDVSALVSLVREFAGPIA